MASHHYSVIVIGAGPVGLLTAINLAKLGVDVAVLEKNEAIDQSPRATSYQPCTLAEMQECGILEDVKAKAMVNNVLSYWIGREPQKERVAYVEKLEGGNVFPAGLNCGQPVLTKTIHDHFTNRYGGQVLFNHSIEKLVQDQDRVHVTCTNPSNHMRSNYTCDWLVGADGAGSTVRKLLEIDFQGFTWPKEQFVATNVRYPFEKFGFSTANFIIDPVHWGVITVIDNTGLWRCAFGAKAGLDKQQILEELDEHYKHLFPGWPGPGYELVQLNPYRPHQRCASTYRKGRCFLAGDAAHSNNPIGGLGLTTGLLDAGPLGRALGAVVRKKAPQSILDTWAKARREKWLNFTNEFSIENKRMVQQGGYSDDPLGIWKLDDISSQHGMDVWINKATPDKRDVDLATFESLKDRQVQMENRMKQWSITMDPLWMADYEDESVVQTRLSYRPPLPAQGKL